jgi:hypothetical protein
MTGCCQEAENLMRFGLEEFGSFTLSQKDKKNACKNGGMQNQSLV